MGCHDESEPFPTDAVFETVHGHPGVDGSPFMPGSSSSFPAGLQCEACHGPVGGHGQRILPNGAVREPIVNFGRRGNASADLQNHFCLACHEDYGRSRWAGSAHEQGDVACADCHRIHSRADPVRLQAGQAAVCLDCHRQVRADLLKLSSHPLRDHQLACRDCHDPHGGSGTGDAVVRESSINQTCYGCHTEKQGPFLWEHPPASEDCGICHLPHGSNQPALLVRRAPQLCQACHSSVGHRSLPQLADRLPSDPGAEFMFANACLNCHAQVHGSNHPLRELAAPMSGAGGWRRAPTARRNRSGAWFRGWSALCGIALALLFTAQSAASAEFTVNYANADTRRWSCRLCAFDKAYAHGGTVAAGAMSAAKGEMRFGRDNGIDRAGGYLDLNADYRLSAKTGWLMEFAGRNLGLTSRDAALRIHKPRRYGVRVRHRETPRNIARDGRSPFMGRETLSLPDNWVPAHGTEDMTQWAAGSKAVELATERRRSDIGAWFSPAPGLNITTGYFRERKQGVREAFRDSFYQATALPAPIDYRVEGTEAGLHYANSTVSMALSYAHREFTNGVEALE